MASAVAAFTGTEPPPPHLAIDAAKLQAWIGGRLPGFSGKLAIAKYKGGQSNPTYRIDTPAAAYVLRRKPPGELVATAHQIDREYRVIGAVSGSAVPVPRPWLYCEDPAVIGSEFYIVSAVAGEVHWRADLPDATPEYRRTYYRDMFRILGEIHRFDYQRAGLSDFGKSSHYTSRNLERWYGNYRRSAPSEIPAMERAAAMLRERLPADEPVTLVHGDFGIHNLIAIPGEPQVAAVLDWEMATIGNPLVDFAHTLRPWLEPYDANSLRPSLVGRDLAALGIPGIDECAELYSAASGICVRDGHYYMAFAMFRYAAMIQGILKRVADGTAANRNIPHTPARVVANAEVAVALLEGRA